MGTNGMNQEQLFASFILDRRSGIEIALPAAQVVEAMPIASPLQPLPASAAFLEGLMHLRDDVIPVINLKKRLSLSETSYASDAKVAVVQLNARRYGLLFDDIRDVLRVPSQAIERLDTFLFSEEAVITDLIKLEQGKRTLELLDLQRLFPGGAGMAGIEDAQSAAETVVQRTYSQFVLYACRGQVYGIPVADAREICFFSDIDQTFKSGVVAGALQLRGQTIPVLCSASLLGCTDTDLKPDEETRILVLQNEATIFGLIVDRVHQILVVADDEIMQVPGGHLPHIHGVCAGSSYNNIILLNVRKLIDAQVDKIKAMARLRNKEAGVSATVSTARHIITEHCYLVFTIGKNYAIELKDVQEIIDCHDFMEVIEVTGLVHGIINLRGRVVPVLDLRRFYMSPGQERPRRENKLIIGRANGNLVALMVDDIVTIYKQEQFHITPSLRSELQPKKDTLDRLIEFINDQGLKEHVLVVNVANILRNHLCIDECEDGPQEAENDAPADRLPHQAKQTQQQE